MAIHCTLHVYRKLSYVPYTAREKAVNVKNIYPGFEWLKQQPSQLLSACSYSGSQEGAARCLEPSAKSFRITDSGCSFKYLCTGLQELELHKANSALSTASCMSWITHLKCRNSLSRIYRGI